MPYSSPALHEVDQKYPVLPPALARRHGLHRFDWLRLSLVNELSRFPGHKLVLNPNLLSDLMGRLRFDWSVGPRPRRRMDGTATEVMTHPTCMIVEDQMLIGLALEAYLEENGFDVAGPFPSKEKALRWLQMGAPDLALLDIMLADGHCLDLARELKRRGIPFAFYSALPPTADMPSELRGVPWLEKPIDRQAVLRTLEELLSPVS